MDVDLKEAQRLYESAARLHESLPYSDPGDRGREAIGVLLAAILLELRKR